MLGEWNFSKRAAVGGDWTFLLKMGRKPGIWGGNQELEGWFYNGGDGKFLKSLYIVGRGVCWPPIFWRPPSPLPPYIPNLSPFSNIADIAEWQTVEMNYILGWQFKGVDKQQFLSTGRISNCYFMKVFLLYEGPAQIISVLI